MFAFMLFSSSSVYRFAAIIQTFRTGFNQSMSRPDHQRGLRIHNYSESFSVSLLITVAPMESFPLAMPQQLLEDLHVSQTIKEQV